MKKLALAAVVALSALAAGLPAHAMAVPNAAGVDDGIVQVAQGCGPGGHRDMYGRCRPNFYRPYGRVCPPGMHPIGYGRCRPNF